MREIATDRLRGRPFEPQDWPFLLSLLTDPRTGPWISRPGAAPDEAAARAAAARMAAHWAAHGFGVRLWTLEGAPAAMAGLRHQIIDGRATVEALWTVAGDLHGRGVAPEAMRAALERDARDAKVVEAWTRPDNAPSQTVAERLGFAPAGDCRWADLPHRLFRLTRP